MPDFFDALDRRLETAHARHQRIRVASLAFDTAQLAVIKAQDTVGHKRPKLGVVDRAQPSLRDAKRKSAEAFAELQAALQARLPAGWEGDVDAPDFISLTDVELWLARVRDEIRDVNQGHPQAEPTEAVAERHISDFYRILDHLQIAKRPKRERPPANVRKAEAVVNGLWAWLLERQSQRTRAETLAELRASLVAVRNHVEQFAKSASPDDYEYLGEAAPKRYQLEDDAAMTAVCNQLFRVLTTTLAPLADRIVETLGPENFPAHRLPPTNDELAETLPRCFLLTAFRPQRLDMDLFGLDEPGLILAGKLMLVWAKWACIAGRDRPPAYRDRDYLPWAANLVNRYQEDLYTWRVLTHPFIWAIRAFDEVAEKIAQVPVGVDSLPTPPATAAVDRGEVTGNKKPTRNRRHRGRRRGGYDEALHQTIYAAYMAINDYDAVASRFGVSIDDARMIVRRHRERDRRKTPQRRKRKSAAK